MNKQTCVVCGANVWKSRNRRGQYIGPPPWPVTCSATCAAAKRAGRTREEQFWAFDQKVERDMRNESHKR